MLVENFDLIFDLDPYRESDVTSQAPWPYLIIPRIRSNRDG